MHPAEAEVGTDGSKGSSPSLARFELCLGSTCEQITGTTGTTDSGGGSDGGQSTSAAGNSGASAKVSVVIVEAIASRVEAIASRLEANATGLDSSPFPVAQSRAAGEVFPLLLRMMFRRQAARVGLIFSL